MKPADDPSKDYKALVERGYDSCAAAYDEVRREETEQALTALIDRLGVGAVVLDVGCGGGVPVARTLAQRFAVTGVDISGKMISRARANVPSGTFIHGDIMSADFPASHFDAVVAFYSVFHLPREEHEELFTRIFQWLKPGGYLLATVAMANEPAYTENDFFGTTMYWSNYSVEEYEEILNSLGFDILEAIAIGHGYDESHETPEEHHPLIFAQKRVE
ncbi:MAG: methyltransferase domain-containing protein [Anaerolineae bacterium]|nr:methyltransferase domain-containing protein [Anaerolineae bacterium]